MLGLLMAVYVDDMRRKVLRRGGGHMLMSHMLADTEAELHAMAAAIGVRRKWFQGDHYDVCDASRKAAVARGAVEVTQRDMVPIRTAFRQQYRAPR